MRKLDPFARHRQQVLGGLLARSGSGYGIAHSPRAVNDNPTPATRAAIEMKLQLIDHKQTLKAIQSRETKIETKRELLPLYADWISGVLLADAPPATEEAADVVSSIMIWRIDVGDYAGALPMIDFVLRHRVPMPAQIGRTVGTFVTEEIADAALAAFDQVESGVQAFPIKVLAELEDLVADEDMHDEVKAKLQKAIARALAADGDESRVRQEETLRRYMRALELNPRAGVKKDIERLQSALKKTEAAAGAPAPSSATEETAA
jgi:hypothetical protein